MAVLVTSCAAPMVATRTSPTDAPVTAAPSAPKADSAPEARIVDPGLHLECVPYARQISGIDLFGDAGTWWEQASGHYNRGSTPRPGAVLSFRPKRESSGHVAVVTRLVSSRVVIASHANWLNQGRIHENTPILDVSDRNDWSAVRVWYTPGKSWGGGVYPTHGFIYVRPMITADK